MIHVEYDCPMVNIKISGETPSSVTVDISYGDPSKVSPERWAKAMVVCQEQSEIIVQALRKIITAC